MIVWRLALAAATFAGLTNAQNVATPSERLLAAHGIERFSPLYRQSLDALFTAWPAYQHGDYAGASRILDAFWKAHPPASREWAAAQGEGERAARAMGVEFGDPPCYYALRMLTECVGWRLRSKVDVSTSPIRFTVVLVGHSHGIQPGTLEDLREHAGHEVRNTLDVQFREAPGPIIDDCFELLFEYIRAITAGRLRLETRILQVPDLDVPVGVTGDANHPTAGLAGGAMPQIWSAVGAEARTSTDWWYILFPSHRPDQLPEFAHTDFSNGGGIGVGPDGASPSQVGDERVLVVKPPKYGGGPVTREERFAFFSQVMQHEFFHHLYRSYPEFRLEQSDHQWFNRAAWPGDFEGFLEPDYYAESLHKRLLPWGNPPLWAKLRYAIPQDVLAKITAADLTGTYNVQPALTLLRVSKPRPGGWYRGSIGADGAGGLRWTNGAGTSWRLGLSGDKRRLTTMPTQPGSDTDFRIVYRQDANGEYLPEVAGFRYNGEFFAKMAVL